MLILQKRLFPMKKLPLFIVSIIVLFCNTKIFAQDTTIVQTLTFDDIYKRSGEWVFPPKTENFRKILLLYTLKCDPKTPWDKYNCGEWDYLTYNIINQKTGLFDSTKMSMKQYSLGSLNNPDTIYYTTNHPYSKYYKKIVNTQITNQTNPQIFEVVNSGLNGSIPDSIVKMQILFPTKYLRDLGMNSGNIYSITFYALSKGLKLNNFTIRLKNTTKTTLDGFDNYELETYYSHNIVSDPSGTNIIVLDTPFKWNKFQGILFELSYEKASNDPLIISGNINQTTLPSLYSSNVSTYLSLDGISDQIYINNISELSETDQFTIEGFASSDNWQSGSAIFSIPNSISLELGDNPGEFRCYVMNPDNTFSLAKSTATIGNWFHFAFVYNGKQVNYIDRIKLYINGTLATMDNYGRIPEKTASSKSPFYISPINKNHLFAGAIDELRIWGLALDEQTIIDWYGQLLNNTHPYYTSLIAYYPLNENSGTIAKDNGPFGYDAKFIGVPEWKQTTPSEIYFGAVPSEFYPQIKLLQGDITIHQNVQIDSTIVPAPNISIVKWKVADHIPIIDSIIYAYQPGYYFTYDTAGVKIDSTLYKYTDYILNPTIDNFYFSEPYPVTHPYEIGRFITPYGIGLDLGTNGFTWVYDVTDYEPLLHDTVQLSAGNLQELIDMKFLFIKGTPPRDVKNIYQIWGPMDSYLYKDLSNDTKISRTLVETIANNQSQFKVKTRITGHGHNSNDGNYPHCCEWKDNTHYLYVEDSLIANWHIFQYNDCALNPVFPQGGTWPGAREGWCPGDVVKDNDFEATDIIKKYLPNSNEFSKINIPIDYDITKVPENNQGMGNGNYVMNFDLIQYGPNNFNNDVEIYDVVSPNSFDYFSRVNPICADPKIIIKNNTEKALTSLDFTYYVKGGIEQNYHWTGSIASQQKAEVVLPVPNSDFWLGDGTSIFHIEANNPNGSPDDYPDNNVSENHFNMPDLYTNKVVLHFKTNLRPGDFSLILKDLEGNSILSLTNLQPNTLYRKELELSQGCYTLEVTDINNYGLSYWALPNQGDGYLKLTDENDGALKVFNPDFGHGVNYSFYYGSYSLVQEPNLDGSIYIYPNPANTLLNISVNNQSNKIQLRVIDLNGKVVIAKSDNVQQGSLYQLNIAGLQSGVYILEVINGKEIYHKKFVIQ